MASPLDLVLAPVKVGFGVAQSAIEVGVGAARAALGAITGGGTAETGPLRDVESQPPRSPRRAEQAPVAEAAPLSRVDDPPVEPPAPSVAASPGAPAPVAEEQHVDTEAVLVATVAERGAEDGAGPELHVDEPWEGYSSMRAPEIQRELKGAGREALAAVELYEQLHKARSSVLDSAARRLAQLS